MDPVLQTTIKVEAKGVESPKATYEFRVPNVMEMARLGSRTAELRAANAPSTGGSEFGLDNFTQDLYRGMGLFETLLDKSSEDWPWSLPKGATKPVVDVNQFPPKAMLVLGEVFRGFDKALDTFLTPGDTVVPAGEEAVAS